MTAINNLLEKASELTNNEYLYTYFGSETYIIKKVSETQFTLCEYRNLRNYLLGMDCLRGFQFNKANFKTKLEEYHFFYSRNATGQCIHMDNITNFVNAFKVCKQV